MVDHGQCMFLLPFFGFVRCSEFLSKSNILRRTKTDQLGMYFPIFRLNSYLIPYEPLTKYLSARYAAHPTPQHPLFSPKQENGHTFHFQNILRISGIF